MARRLIPFLILSLMLLAGLAPLAQAGIAKPPAEHLILISIDGFRPDTYLNTSEYGIELPTLLRLKKEGAHAKGVLGIYPTVTYPSHTTILTGVLSDVHGVVANSKFGPGNTGPANWYWDANEIQVPTIWDAAKAKGLEVANLSWPVSRDCPCDYNIPEIWDNSSREQTGTLALLQAASTPRGIIDRIGENTTPWTDINYNINSLERDLLVGDAAAWMFRQYEPNLFTIHLIEVDHFSHEEGPNGESALRALQYADQAIGKIVAAVEAADLADATTIIITGDHGFADIQRTFYPNQWLKEGGFLTADGEGNITSWMAQFHTSAASGALMLHEKVDPSLAGQVFVDFSKRLKDLPERDRPFTILTRDDLDWHGAFPAAAWGLAMKPGWSLSRSVDRGVFGEASGGNHGYDPHWDKMHTGFIIWGAGIARGGRADLVPMTGIAPTIADLMGLDMPHAFDAPFEWAIDRRWTPRKQDIMKGTSTRPGRSSRGGTNSGRRIIR